MFYHWVEQTFLSDKILKKKKRRKERREREGGKEGKKEVQSKDGKKKRREEKKKKKRKEGNKEGRAGPLLLLFTFPLSLCYKTFDHMWFRQFWGLCLHIRWNTWVSGRWRSLRLGVAYSTYKYTFFFCFVEWWKSAILSLTTTSLLNLQTISILW